MNKENNPPSINELLDQGFDLQYFNPPAEYPIPLENDWYLKFIQGPIKVVNPPPIDKKRDPSSKARANPVSKTPRKEPLKPTSPLKDTQSNRAQQEVPARSPTPPRSSQSPTADKGKENTQKRPTVSEIEDNEPIPQLNTEILQQVHNDVAKEILNRHKAEVEAGIQKRVAQVVLKNAPKGYADLQSVDFDEDEYLEKEEKRRQKEREKAQKAANVHRRRSASRH